MSRSRIAISTTAGSTPVKRYKTVRIVDDCFQVDELLKSVRTYDENSYFGIGTGLYTSPTELRNVDTSLWVVADLDNSASYDPMLIPQLHSRVARLPLTAEGARRLVRGFGFLNLYQDNHTYRDRRVCCAPLTILLYEIWRIRLFRDFHIAIQSQDYSFLRTRSTALRDAIGLGFDSMPIGPAEVLPDHYAQTMCRETDLEAEARCLLASALTAALTGIRLRASVDSGTEGQSLLSFDLTTTTLLNAVYLQLAIAMERSQGSRTCPECGQDFILTRADRIYCTDACSSAKRQR